MDEKQDREILEFKQFLQESREKPDLDRYAHELFGERMAALGFTTFKYHRWYKLVRDELLLSFGLLPVTREMVPTCVAQIGIQPLFVGIQGQFVEKFDGGAYPPCIRLVSKFNMAYPQSNETDMVFYYSALTSRDHKRAQEMFETVISPTLMRCSNVRRAFEHFLWENFIAERYQLKQPIPAAYQHKCIFLHLPYYVFFCMYDEYMQGEICALANSWHLTDEQGRYDYDYVVQWLRERDSLPNGFEQIERGEYDALDAALHAEYEASLRTIRRRLKLEPDCKDTIWDRGYRRPVDIQKTIEESFARCAPRAAQGDYTIDTL